MKFISKSSNLLIVLRPGLSAQPLTGTPAKPTISVRFTDGVAEVHQQELIDMMLAHPAFNGDFISAETVAVDPYAATRQPSEPAHVMTEMKFGTPVARKEQGGASKLPPEFQKLVQDAALEVAKGMLPEMLKSIVESHKASKEEGEVKKPSVDNYVKAEETTPSPAPKRRGPKTKAEKALEAAKSASEEIKIQDVE